MGGGGGAFPLWTAVHSLKLGITTAVFLLGGKYGYAYTACRPHFNVYSHRPRFTCSFSFDLVMLHERFFRGCFGSIAVVTEQGQEIEK